MEGGFKSVVGFVRENAEKEKKGLKEVPSNISLYTHCTKHTLHYITITTTTLTFSLFISFVVLSLS